MKKSLKNTKIYKITALMIVFVGVFVVTILSSKIVFASLNSKIFTALSVEYSTPTQAAIVTTVDFEDSARSKLTPVSTSDKKLASIKVFKKGPVADILFSSFTLDQSSETFYYNTPKRYVAYQSDLATADSYKVCAQGTTGVNDQCSAYFKIADLSAPTTVSFNGAPVITYVNDTTATVSQSITYHSTQHTSAEVIPNANRVPVNYVVQLNPLIEGIHPAVFDKPIDSSTITMHYNTPLVLKITVSNLDLNKSYFATATQKLFGVTSDKTFFKLADLKSQTPVTSGTTTVAFGDITKTAATADSITISIPVTYTNQSKTGKVADANLALEWVNTKTGSTSEDKLPSANSAATYGKQFPATFYSSFAGDKYTVKATDLTYLTSSPIYTVEKINGIFTITKGTGASPGGASTNGNTQSGPGATTGTNSNTGTTPPPQSQQSNAVGTDGSKLTFKINTANREVEKGSDGKDLSTQKVTLDGHITYDKDFNPTAKTNKISAEIYDASDTRIAKSALSLDSVTSTDLEFSGIFPGLVRTPTTVLIKDTDSGASSIKFTIDESGSMAEFNQSAAWSAPNSTTVNGTTVTFADPTIVPIDNTSATVNGSVSYKNTAKTGGKVTDAKIVLRLYNIDSSGKQTVNTDQPIAIVPTYGQDTALVAKVSNLTAGQKYSVQFVDTAYNSATSSAKNIESKNGKFDTADVQPTTTTPTDGTNPDQSNSEKTLLEDPLKPGLNSIPAIVSAVVDDIVIPIAVPFLALAIIYTGFLFVRARGNATKLEEAKKALMWTLIGGAIILGAYVIATAIQSTISSIVK